ncbi:MAG: galactokinase [Bacteroidota bacterium]|nr:galactokinase [Bacteroidota bacterium]
MVTLIRQLFNEHFGKAGLLVRSPGRINLIGEHTDYNLGFVLPAAIDKAIYIAIKKREDRQIRLVAGDLEQQCSSSLDALESSELQWPNYILGVVQKMIQAGYPLSGFEAVVMGDVPLGAGLSSSAAVECATAFALNSLFDLGLEKIQMVKLAQKAENEFVGVQCGIMDQFASMFGKKQHVIKLDCRSLEYAYMPFDSSDVRILLFDTGVKHSLASTEYNLRRQECEAGVAIIRKKFPQVQSLRDADLTMVEACLSDEDPKVYMRCKYMVEEIQRLQEACVDLQQHDLGSFGKKMFATHEGLSKLYEVSCPEADNLVKWVSEQPAVMGARMMGGGFGGCTLNIVRKEMADSLINTISDLFEKTYHYPLKTYTVSIDDGTSLIEN